MSQHHLDKENHREIYSKKQSTSRKKQSGTSSNPVYTGVFFEPFLLRFLLSKWYWSLGAALASCFLRHVGVEGTG
jgi:hypothetical protein